MARPIAPSVVQDAIILIMQSAGRGLPVDTDMARTLAARLAPAVEDMGLHGVTSSALSSQAAFHALVSQHLGAPSAATYDPAFRRQLLQAIESANIHGPDYLGGVFDGIRLALGPERAAPDTRDPSSPSGRRDYSTLPANNGNVSPAEFMTSTNPQAVMLRTMGMTGDTYSYMRTQGFSTATTERAARFARQIRFGVNDRGMLRDIGTIIDGADDPDRVLANIGRFQAALEANDEFTRAVLAVRDARTAEDRRRAEAERDRIAADMRKQYGITDDIARQHSTRVQEAINGAATKVQQKREEAITAAPPAPTAAPSAGQQEGTTSTAAADALLAPAPPSKAPAPGG